MPTEEKRSASASTAFLRPPLKWHAEPISQSNGMTLRLCPGGVNGVVDDNLGGPIPRSLGDPYAWISPDGRQLSGVSSTVSSWPGPSVQSYAGEPSFGAGGLAEQRPLSATLGNSQSRPGRVIPKSQKRSFASTLIFARHSIHSITSWARSSRVCGIVSPSAFAVFWLIVR